MAERVVMVETGVPFGGPTGTGWWRRSSPDRLVAVDGSDRAAVDAALAEAEVAILAGDLEPRHVAAPKLRWIHCDHAGLTKSARPEVFQKGLVVTGSAGRSGPALAEHVMMFSLMLCSRYPDFYEAQKRHEWRRTPEMADLRALYGRTIGILGMGHTGVELASRAKAFNMRVLGYRRRDMATPPGVDRMYAADKGETIDDILREADILALVLNLSDATHHLIGAREIAMMKPSAIIVNLARGGIIDTDALVAALRRRPPRRRRPRRHRPRAAAARPPALGRAERAHHPAFHRRGSRQDRSLARRHHRKPAPLARGRADAEPDDRGRPLDARPGPGPGELSHAGLRRPPHPLHDPDADRDLDRLLHPDPAPPGDFVTSLAAQMSQMGDTIDPNTLAMLRAQYGLDEPIWVQYWIGSRTSSLTATSAAPSTGTRRSRTCSGTGSG